VRAVIIDDHIFVREIVRKLCLEEVAIEVTAESGCGYAALAEIKHIKPDLIVLDVGLWPATKAFPRRHFEMQGGRG
jgi:DNA-binding NarL/FixJ family response regulator